MTDNERDETLAQPLSPADLPLFWRGRADAMKALGVNTIRAGLIEAYRECASELETAIRATPLATGHRYRHVKTGGIYIEIARGDLQGESNRIVVYRSDAKGSLWIRPEAEFDDGRFVEIERTVPATDTGMREALEDEHAVEAAQRAMDAIATSMGAKTLLRSLAESIAADGIKAYRAALSRPSQVADTREGDMEKCIAIAEENKLHWAAKVDPCKPDDPSRVIYAAKSAACFQVEMDLRALASGADTREGEAASALRNLRFYRPADFATLEEMNAERAKLHAIGDMRQVFVNQGDWIMVEMAIRALAGRSP